MYEYLLQEDRANPGKIILMSFTKNHNVKTLTLHGNDVEQETKGKNFGITLDKTLLWETHFGRMCWKATRALEILKSIAGSKLGCARKCDSGNILQ